MKNIYMMIVKAFTPVFLTALLFFVLILQLVDLFANLWRYINNDATFIEMGRVALYYFPKCIMFSLPIASLFAVAYTLGTYQKNNELIALYGSGISLRKFSFPLLMLGVLFSIGGFYFEDKVVIDSYRMKNELSRELLNQNQSLSKSKPTVISADNRLIYHAEYYNNSSQTLSDLTIIERSPNGSFIKRVDADWAEWKEDHWVLHDARGFTQDDEGNINEKKSSILDEIRYDNKPSGFQKIVRDIEEMPIVDAKIWIDSLMKAGLSFRGPLTDYYRRYSFALTPFIVVLISASLGGRFKKNILLMSLLTSLSVSVIYYVFEMVTVLLANNGYLTPLAGAWTPFIFFSLIGIILFRFSRS